MTWVKTYPPGQRQQWFQTIQTWEHKGHAGLSTYVINAFPATKIHNVLHEKGLFTLHTNHQFAQNATVTSVDCTMAQYTIIYNSVYKVIV